MSKVMSAAARRGVSRTRLLAGAIMVALVFAVLMSAPATANNHGKGGGGGSGGGNDSTLAATVAQLEARIEALETLLEGVEKVTLDQVDPGPDSEWKCIGPCPDVWVFNGAALADFYLEDLSLIEDD